MPVDVVDRSSHLSNRTGNATIMSHLEVQSELDKLRDKHEALKRQFASSVRGGSLDTASESDTVPVVFATATAEVVGLMNQLQQARVREQSLLVQLVDAQDVDLARRAAAVESVADVDRRKTKAKEAGDQAAKCGRKLAAAKRDSLDSVTALKRELISCRRDHHDCQRELAARSDRVTRKYSRGNARQSKQ